MIWLQSQHLKPVASIEPNRLMFCFFIQWKQMKQKTKNKASAFPFRTGYFILKIIVVKEKGIYITF